MKPILFNTEMVRAFLANRKQVTRRVVKPHYRDGETGFRIVTNAHTSKYVRVEYFDEWEDETRWMAEPYRPGDILYVRETFFEHNGHYYYKADGKHEALAQLGITFKWRPSIHMPREAARIFLWVADVRVERLQDSFCRHGSAILLLQREGIDIGEQCRDCIKAYGSPCCSDDDSECGVLDEVRGEFLDLWDSTIKPADRDLYGWVANPYVWVITFERISREEAAQ